MPSIEIKPEIIANGKKTKTPRQYDSILKGALALSLADRVALKKELQASIEGAVRFAKLQAEEAEKISKE